MSKFKVGDPVECLIYGKGEVIEIESGRLYPVRVKFQDLPSEDQIESYTQEGKWQVSAKPTLTIGTWKVEEIPPEVTYKKGELVWCDINNSAEWQLAAYQYKSDNRHLVNLKVGSHLWNVRSTSIRKFKDNPYDIND